MLESTISNPIFSALALTLIHFLWQGVLIAGALKLLLLFISKRASLIRYSLSCFAMCVSLVVPVITSFWCYHFYFPEAAPFTFSQEFLLPVETIKNTQEIAVQNWQTLLNSYMPYLGILWLAVVVLLTAKLLCELLVLSRLPYRHTLPVDNILQDKFNQLVSQLNLKQSPKLVISLTVDVPMAMGWLKPIVLLPANMLTGLSTAQLEMLLLHELAHIRRHDYLVNFLQTLIEILLFFHPAVMWISKQMRQEREHCSDDIAVAHCGNAVAYAHTLADTASLCSKHRHPTIPTMAMAATEGDLKERVVRLIDHQCTNNTDAGRWFAGALLALSLIVITSKQFVSLPQFNLTVEEIGFVAFYNEPSTKSIEQERHLDVQPELLETTIAQQLVAKQHPFSAQRPSTQLFTNITDVHVPKLIKIDSSELEPSKRQTETSFADNTMETNKTLIVSERVTQANESQHLAYGASAPISTSTGTSNGISENAFEMHQALSVPANAYAEKIAALSQPVAEKSDHFNHLDTLSFDQNTLSSLVSDHVINKPSHLVAEELPLNVNKNGLDVPVKYEATSIKMMEPKYPLIAKRKGIELDITVKFTIGADGRVHDIQFQQKNKVSYFKNSILTAMRKWRFLPAQEDGHPVESEMSKIFSFSLAT